MRGGKRPNSGRKNTGRVPLQVRMKPEVIADLSNRAKRSLVGRGIIIEELLKNYISKEEAQKCIANSSGGGNWRRNFTNLLK